MTTCDSRAHNVRVGDVVRLWDDNENRELKITPSPGPVVLKRKIQTNYRSFYGPRHNSSSALPHGQLIHADRHNIRRYHWPPSSHYSPMLWNLCCECIQPRSTVSFGRVWRRSTLVCETQTLQERRHYDKHKTTICFSKTRNILLVLFNHSNMVLSIY